MNVTANRIFLPLPALALIGLLAGCAAVTDRLVPPPTQTLVLAPAHFPRPRFNPSGPTLEVAAPDVRPGFDSPRMVYTRRPFELNYFANNQWADRPGRMLAGIMAATLASSGQFSAVLGAASGLPAGLRLESELQFLGQEFHTAPSQGRIRLLVRLVDLNGQRVIASDTFEASAPAPTEDPYGGVSAINRALAQVLDQVTAFCAATLEGAAASPG